MSDGGGLNTNGVVARRLVSGVTAVVATLAAALVAVSVPVGANWENNIRFAFAPPGQGFNGVVSSVQPPPANANYLDTFVIDDITLIPPPRRSRSSTYQGVTFAFTGPLGASVQF